MNYWNIRYLTKKIVVTKLFIFESIEIVNAASSSGSHAPLLTKRWDPFLWVGSTNHGEMSLSFLCFFCMVAASNGVKQIRSIFSLSFWKNSLLFLQISFLSMILLHCWNPSSQNLIVQLWFISQQTWYPSNFSTFPNFILFLLFHCVFFSFLGILLLFLGLIQLLNNYVIDFVVVLLSISSLKVFSFVLNFTAFCISKHSSSHWILNSVFWLSVSSFDVWAGFTSATVST